MRYLEVLSEGTGTAIRDKDLAADAGVRPEQVSRWRNEVPGFNEWLAGEFRAFVAHRWPAVKVVALRFALRGSIKHMEFLRDLIEPLPPRASQVPGGAPRPLVDRAVIINLPVPPGELAGHTVVRGLLEHAIDASTLPAAASG